MRHLIFAIIIFCWTTPAFANMAQPWRDGSIGGEPRGIERVHVVHEELQFDLRDEDGGRAQRDRVTATYELDNRGAAESLELQFVAVGMPGDASFDVQLNGENIVAKMSGQHPIPPEWKAPTTTPLPGGGTVSLSGSNVDTAASIRFTAPLEPGKNRVEVRYELEPSATVDGRYWVRQTAYVLAPAREWASFGSLHIEVLAPDGVDIATSLELQESDGVLTGEFRGLPADTFTIATRPRPPFGSLAAFYIIVVGGALLAVWFGVLALLRRFRFPALISAVAATVATLPTSVVALWSSEFLLGPSGPGWGYALLFIGMPTVVLVAAVGGTIGTLAVWALPLRRTARAAARPGHD